MPTPTTSRDTAESDRYKRIAQLAAERDQRERELIRVESELRRVVYQLDEDDE